MIRPSRPERQGLYDPQNEHDACGVGFVCHIRGKKSHEIVEQGLLILKNLTHRGAVGADPKASDGAGILVHHSGNLRAEAIADWAGADVREREALTELADFARPHGVRIALENIFTTELGQYRQTPTQVAETVKAVNHPNVVALIDFSHAYIESTFKGLDFRAEIRAMAPVAGHLHLHDSFGRPQGFFKPFHLQENTAMGIGDLHMPLGWGDIAWDEIFAELGFLPDTVAMMEIGRRYRREQPESLVRARALSGLDTPTAVAAE